MTEFKKITIKQYAVKYKRFIDNNFAVACTDQKNIDDLKEVIAKDIVDYTDMEVWTIKEKDELHDAIQAAIYTKIITIVEDNFQEKSIMQCKATNRYFTMLDYYYEMLKDSVTYERSFYDEIENDQDFIDVTETHNYCEDCNEVFEIEIQTRIPNNFPRIICDSCYIKQCLSEG